MAERVERFDPEFDSAGEFPNGQSIVMDPYDEGDWVRFSDYERVEKERDEVAKLLEERYRKCRKAEVERDELLGGIEAASSKLRMRGNEEPREVAAHLEALAGRIKGDTGSEKP